jgi:PAS domain S-box-containing protein
MADALAAGARDVVSLTHRGRLQAVVERELRARRLQAALDGVLSSATQYKQELRNLMKGATEAMADVQEGIVITANPAWLAMFGLEQENDLAGQPFMDLFSDRDVPSLKGAMQACLRGKWSNSGLHVTAMRRTGAPLGLELKLEHVTVDGEPAVRFMVPAEKTAAAAPEEIRPRVFSCAIISSNRSSHGCRSPLVPGCVRSPTSVPTTSRACTVTSGCSAPRR